jgi:hypothetical protein
MKKRFILLSMAALAFVGTILTSCSSDDIISDEPQQLEKIDDVVTQTTTVCLDGTATTRALTAGGVKTFGAGEQIAVVYENTSDATVRTVSVPLTAADIASGSKSATFTVTLTNPKPGGSVKYIYPAAMAKPDGSENYDALAGQDGTLAYLSSFLDFAKYEGTLTAEAKLPTSSVTLTNQLAILALTVKNSDGSSDLTSTITDLTINDGTNSYFVSRAAAAGPIYVAVKPTTAADINVTAFDGTYVYTKSLSSKSYAANNFYNLGWRMTTGDNMLTTPLTLEAKTDGTIHIKKPTDGMKYKKNTDGKVTFSKTDAIDINVSAGDKVQFFGNGTSITSYSDGSHVTDIYDGTAECYIYGNIMSLVNESGFASATSVSANAFQNLFADNRKLYNHPTKRLVLPATTLAENCYYAMFTSCWGLTVAPALPATTLADHCYADMFYDCWNLNVAPALPAKTLASYCYSDMFLACTRLTVAPALPATTLADYCYTSMFQDCSSLTIAPVLSATTLAEGCCLEMFKACTSLTTVPATLPATTLASSCYQQMFFRCTSLTNAPALPAPTLAGHCYVQMFAECSSLSTVTCLATSISGTDIYRWLYGVAANGTFTKTSGMTSWGTGISGIPSGWTVKDYIAPTP